MMTMSANVVLMDGDAELGPIDPQLVFRKGDGSVIQAPAQAVVDQFEEAQALIGKDASKLPAWLATWAITINSSRTAVASAVRRFRTA
jgi:hypothetical protein